MANDPKIASVALIHGGEVLLIQRARQPFAGYWTLPGGRLEPGEDAATAARREIAEELGLTVHALRPVIRFEEPGAGDLQVFATEAFEGGIVPQQEEIADWRWVAPHLLGALPVTPRLGEVLDRALALFDRR
jgi:ADP-ribose pyrophosphatase YjhB (NUDIX family)